MPAKKKGDKKGGKGKDKEEDKGADPATLISNYLKLCKALVIQPHKSVERAMRPEGDPDSKNEPPPPTQLVIDSRENIGTEEGSRPLGAGGVRALVGAILGDGPGLTDPYKLIKSIRIWHCELGDDGIEFLVDLFKSKVLFPSGKEGVPPQQEINIQYLDLMDNNIGVRGCRLFAETLGFLQTAKLLTLKLDYNYDIGSDGCQMLCRGLKSSVFLKQLHLAFCNIHSGAGGALSDLVSGAYGAKLTVLNLQGNKLGCDGLAKMCAGIEKSKTLERLNISDNSVVEDTECMEMFGSALVANVSLTHVDMMYNRIGVEGATALAPHVEGNPRIKVLKVDESLPQALFERLCRQEKKEKKKKGKKGKKKKK